MSERASQTAQRYVDAMNIASAKIEQLQAEVAALRARIAPWTGTTMREHMSCNDLAVSEGGCAGENCRLPVCVVCGRTSCSAPSTAVTHE